LSERQRLQIIQVGFTAWGFDTRGWSKITRDNYRRTIARADRWLVENQRRTIFTAEPRDLRAFLFQQSPNAKNRNNIRQALVSWYDYLRDEGVRDDNPATDLPRLKEPKSLPRAVDTDIAARLAEILPTLEPMDRALVALWLYAGLRRAESLQLRWSSWDPAGYLQVTGKGSKDRVVPLHPVVTSALRSWRAINLDPELVFPSPRGTGRPISSQMVKDTMGRVLDALGVEERMTPHQLRHTVATNMIEQGVPIHDVQAFLGHSSIQTTAIYLRVRPSNLRAAVEAVSFEKATATPIEMAKVLPANETPPQPQQRSGGIDEPEQEIRHEEV
jgi:site-specific recombinase XerD